MQLETRSLPESPVGGVGGALKNFIRIALALGVEEETIWR
jgi:hypothetical protein